MLYVKAWSPSKPPYNAVAMGEAHQSGRVEFSWAPTVTIVATQTIDHGLVIGIYAGAISTQLSLNLIGKRF